MNRQSLDSAIRKANGTTVLPPGTYQNTIKHFFFTDAEILQANEEGKLLKLDLDVGRYCDLGCGFCYVSTHGTDTSEYVQRTTERVKGIITEGADLGLKAIKIIGAGEPTLFPGLLKIIEHAHSKGVGTLLFTAGHLIADDSVVAKIFRADGVRNGADIVERLSAWGSAVILKYMSFDDEWQTQIVNSRARKFKGTQYAELRDRALLLFVEQRFNAVHPTRLGVDTLLLEGNYAEAQEIFSLFNSHNIFVLMKTPVNCGGTAVEKEYAQTITREHAEEAAFNVYEYCRAAGLSMALESPYFGGPPCSQLNHALHIGDNSEVKACPGAKVPFAKYEPGNLAQIWKDNLRRIGYAGALSHHCLPRHGVTMDVNFGSKIAERIGIPAPAPLPNYEGSHMRAAPMRELSILG